MPISKYCLHAPCTNGHSSTFASVRHLLRNGDRFLGTNSGTNALLVIPVQFPPHLNSHFSGLTPPSFNTHKMTHEERMTKALAALDLQERPKYAPMVKEYGLEHITLAKLHKGQTTSRAITNSKS